MPRFCGIFGCTNKENKKEKKSFFRLPAARKYNDPDLTRLRRLKWLAAIRREDLTELKMKYLWICEDHFISGRPADYRDISNPDWVPSLKMGYEKNDLMDCPYESSLKRVKDADCLNADSTTGKQKDKLLITEQITPSCSEIISSKDKLRILVDHSFLSSEKLLVEKNSTIYSKTNKENKPIDSTLLQKKAPIEENFTFKNLLRNLPLIEKPNILWGISAHLNVVICARWNEDYICEKKVIIDNSLVVRVFLNELEINLSELMNITCIDDISNLLGKVESYKIP